MQLYDQDQKLEDTMHKLDDTSNLIPTENYTSLADLADARIPRILLFEIR